jgi:2'-hydroxyisoflavone reductase
MDLLILGGTLFLGREIVEAALARRHRVTLFHRGTTNPSLFPDVEHLHGDRDGGLGALAGRRWDAVIDTCGYLPRVVGASAETLAGAVSHYTFISSLSVYADHSAPGTDESGGVGTLADPTDETFNGATYGPLKALCERAVDHAFPGGILHIRPGLIVGPHDPTDRLTWWTRRIARGGDVLAPGDPAASVQVVDARDLADWTVRMVEARTTGVFNAVGPASGLTFARMLEACCAVVGGDARITWIDEAFLLDRDVTPWTELPVWVPRAMAGFMRVNASRAHAAGLTFRPIEDTLRDLRAWDLATPLLGRPAKSGLSFPVGMTPEREAKLLAEWRERQVPTGA